MKPSTRHTLAALACLWLLTGCSSDRDESAPALAARAPTPLPGAERELAPGTLDLEVHEGRVSLSCEQVPRLAVLRRLAEAAGFTLDARDLPSARLSLRIDDAPLPAVLPELLQGVPYQTDYALDPQTGTHSLVWLGAGSAVTAKMSGPEPSTGSGDEDRAPAPSGAAFLSHWKRRVAEMTPEERDRIDEDWNENAEEQEPELLRRLEDPDPSIRAEAVLELPVGGDPEKRAERMQRLAGLVQDPESMVRLAAIERLGEIENRDSLEALVPALTDPNREVVMEAISAMEDIDDPAAIPHLRPLLQDRDEEVRSAAEFAIDWIED